MKTLYLDCYSGISGDMFAAAMLDLGADAQGLLETLRCLPLGGYHIDIAKKPECGIASTDFDVVLEAAHESAHVGAHEGAHHHTHRHWSDIRAMLQESTLAPRVRELSLEIFDIMAKAEGKIHSVSENDVEFHEVGAVDSIVDVVSAAWCMTALAPARVVCSPLTVGGGTVLTQHGVLPVPAPATAEILRAKGVPFTAGNIQTELVTPTGAAIVAALADAFGSLPAMTAASVGYGRGKKRIGQANLLRVFLGETADAPADTVGVLETCVDDTTGEALGYCMEKLFAAGALDAYFTPVFMKKNRPAYALTVLCREADIARMADLVFRHTGAIGLRSRVSERIVMQRENRKIATEYGEIDCKICRRGDLTKCKPEYESLREAAERSSVPLDKITEKIPRV